MRRISLLLVIFLCQLSCLENDKIRQQAEPIVMTDDGFIFKMTADAWRDFMPGTSPPNTRLKVHVQLEEINGKSITEFFELKSMVVLNGNKKWKTKFDNIDIANSDKGMITGFADDGPEWDLDSKLDVICLFARKKGSEDFKIIHKDVTIIQTQ